MKKPLKKRCGNNFCTRKAEPCTNLCVKHEKERREGQKRNAERARIDKLMSQGALA